MKHVEVIFLSLFIMMGLTINVIAQPMDTLWAKTYGGTDDEEGYSVQQTTDGGYILAGFTRSFGNGIRDAYLIKTNILGDAVWTKTFGDTLSDIFHSVQQTIDSGYIAVGYTYSFGNGSSDVYLVKIDANGNTQWTKTFGGTDFDLGHCVQQTLDGGFIIIGWSDSYGSRKAYLVKTDSSGNPQWTKTHGSMAGEKGYDVQETSDGGYIIVGETAYFGNLDVYLVKTDSIGNEMWTRRHGWLGEEIGYSVKEISNGFIIVGQEDSYGGGQQDIWLLKTNINGDTVWAKSIGGTAGDFGRSIEITSDENYLIAGYTSSYGSGGLDFYLLKTDTDGNTLWTRTYGGSQPDYAYSAQETSDGGYAIFGYTQSFGAGNTDFYLVKTEPDVGIKEQKSCRKVSFVCKSEPNPFNNRTQIKYVLPQSNMVNIVVYNLLGQEIKTLVNRKENEGIHTITWDGSDNSDNKVPGGIYFLKLETGKYNTTRKLLKMR